MLNSSAYVRREPRRALRAPAADDDRRPRAAAPASAARASRRPGGACPRSRMLLADRRRPQAGDDLELLLEHLEARRRSAGTGCRTPRARASYQPAPSPSSTRPPLIASACATWIASAPGKRNVTGVTSVPSRMRVVSRPSAASVIHASVEPGPGVAVADAQVVVGAEERVEAELARRAGRRRAAGRRSRPAEAR